MLPPLKRAARLIERSIHLHAALDSLLKDGVELLHAIEETEHERIAIGAAGKKRRRPRGGA